MWNRRPNKKKKNKTWLAFQSSLYTYHEVVGHKTIDPLSPSAYENTRKTPCTQLCAIGTIFKSSHGTWIWKASARLISLETGFSVANLNTGWRHKQDRSSHLSLSFDRGLSKPRSKRMWIIFSCHKTHSLKQTIHSLLYWDTVSCMCTWCYLWVI